MGVVVKRTSPRVLIISGLLALCLGVEYYIHMVFGATRVYPHLYYFPILLAALWWDIKGGVSVGLLLGFAHIASYYPQVGESPLWRGAGFVFAGLLVGTISAKRKQVAKSLKERVNELNCLYGLSKLVEKGASLEEINRGLVDLLPPAWRYPEVAYARIILNGCSYQSPNFGETPWKQTSKIVALGQPIGILEVGYLEERPPADEGPFLKEERVLINALAEQLGRIVEREKAREALEESNRLRNLFLDILIHDLSNPLTVINMYLEEASGFESGSIPKMVCGIVREQTDRMNSLIDKAIDFARLHRLVGIDKKDINLNQHLDRVIKELFPIAGMKRIKIDFEPSADSRVKANEIIDQVFTNLLSNAIKYSPEETRVTIRVENPGDFVRVSFKDQGEGISDENKELVFTRFERVHKGPVKGVGLGLALARKITGLHDGRIWVEDNPDGGSVFIVELPVS